MCLECGFYKGRIVIDMKAQKAARDARLQAKKSMRDAQAGQNADTTNTEDTTNEDETTNEEQATETEQK